MYSAAAQDWQWATVRVKRSREVESRDRPRSETPDLRRRETARPQGPSEIAIALAVVDDARTEEAEVWAQHIELQREQRHAVVGFGAQPLARRARSR